MRTRRLVPALCAASVLLFSACGDSNSPSDGGNPPPDGDILVRNNFYEPATFQVTAGTTVTWAWNSGGASHSVTFDGDPNQNSGTKGSGTFERTFSTAGAYTYHCLVHPDIMRGTITVTATAGGGGTGGGGGGTGDGGMGGGGGYDY